MTTRETSSSFRSETFARLPVAYPFRFCSHEDDGDCPVQPTGHRAIIPTDTRRDPDRKGAPALRIPHPVSHLSAVFVMYRIWLRYCSLQDWLLLGHMPMRNGIMETSLAADVEKDSDHALWRDISFSNACASPPLATVTNDGKGGSTSLLA